MRCGFCSKSNPEFAIICKNCGNATRPPSYRPESERPPRQSGAAWRVKSGYSPVKTERTRRERRRLIGLIAVCVVFVVIIAIFFLSLPAPPQITPAGTHPRNPVFSGAFP